MRILFSLKKLVPNTDLALMSAQPLKVGQLRCAAKRQAGTRNVWVDGLTHMETILISAVPRRSESTFF